MRKKTKEEQRQRRHASLRAKVFGTAERPRVSVFRSLRGMYVQLIDDEKSQTVLSINNKKDLPKKFEAGERQGKLAVAYVLGQELAKKAKELSISQVVFDRGGNAYHGRVQALADGAREGGLEF